MNWPKAYLDSIRSGETAACEKIKAVYGREVGWIENPPDDFPFYFDEEAGEHVIGFIEKFCKHYEGRWGGRPIQLEPFQKAKIQLIFGWKEKLTRLRRIREVVDIRARKCGKSTESAAIELNMLLNDGENGAKIYCTANKKEQADIIFEAAVNMRAQSPAICAITKKRQNDIYFPDTFSYIRSIAADTKTMDGLNAHYFSQDEFHEAHDRKMYDVMKQSQSAREQPLAGLISTNGFVREGFFDIQYDYCSHVAMWDEGFQDYRTLPLIYELDSREEWTDESCWEKANPGLGKIKSIDFLRENVERAKRDPSFLPTVLTKDFNIPENTSAAWLTYEDAVNETKIDPEYVNHSYAVGGCDLSSTTDLTCATLLIRRPNDENFYVLQHYFIPEKRVNDTEASSKREAPYRLWATQGWVTICDGAKVDFHAVTQWFTSMVNERDIRPLWIGYDAALSGYWVPEMQSYGFDLEKIRQGPYTFTYPMKTLGGLCEEHKIIYDNNPILRWCLLNTGAKTLNKDGINSIQPVKTGKTKRIDGMVSLLNAFTCYQNHEEEYLRYVR
ncbi:MAG: terminase TerL endonuclease subunit [Christensenella sp.]|nr:terminase TerL endonuclease subunit [Christensenella sp.]